MAGTDNSLAPLEVDLSDVQSFEPFPEGIYQLAVISVKNQRKSKSNDSYICWDLVLQVAEGEFAKRKVWHTLTYGAELQGFMASFLKACGIPFDETKGATNTIDPASWLGKMCYAQVVQDQYQGKANNKIKSFVVRD